MGKLTKVQSIGFDKEFLRQNKILFRVESGIPKNHVYCSQSMGSHREETLSLLSGDYNKANEFFKNLLEFTGESVKQTSYTQSDKSAVSNVEFSDGCKVYPVMDGCSLPITLVSRGEILVDEDLLLTENESKEIIKKRLEDLCRGIKDNSLKGMIIRKHLEEVSKTKLEPFINSIRDADYRTIESLRYKTRKPIPEVREEDYMKCKVCAIGERNGLFSNELELFGRIESADGVYSIPLDNNITLVRNTMKVHGNFSPSIREVVKTVGNLTDCNALINHALDKSKTDVTSVYVETISRPSLALSVFGLEENTSLKPQTCFVKLEQGSRTKTIEAPYYAGITLWSKDVTGNLMVRDVGDRVQDK
jgi:hypothetical protein